MRSPDERIVALLQEARLQLETERSRRTEPIAIVGIGCHFPGGASSPAAFWNLLEQGFDATSEVPVDRWAAEEFYDPNPDAPGKAYTKRGSFLTEGVAGFDADFFGISPREAIGMDPQQRLLLEVVWEALEDAGIAPERLRGSATGVWVGLCVDDYARRSSADVADIDAYNTLGNTRSIAAGRISYVLDLHGPTVQLDTACSSSLVALHQAGQSLRSRECDLALVGGVNLMLAPEPTIALCKLRALAPDGHCKTFDASADGYGRGEGCGIVVLKRLADAVTAGDRIYAVVRGSACNHDGHSNGLTAPSGIAQEAVIRAALANAGVEGNSVDYVEAHGTGTLLGDPIEVLALHRVYGQGRSTNSPLYLGAVKTNFGHLEGAAGVAGVIKAALCLRHGAIPRHLHMRQPNPKIPWADLAVKVASEPVDWARNGIPRFAGVSSFGISGTNAHVVLEEAPATEPAMSMPRRAAELVVLTAKTPEALPAVAGRLREHLESHPELVLGDVAYSLVTTRSLQDHRLTVTAASRTTLLDALAAAAFGKAPVGISRGPVASSSGKLAWLFTGQGAQRLGMGRELYAEWLAFREALDAAAALLDPQLEVPLREVMWAEPGSASAALLDQTGFTQPALFAFEWALAQLWRSWGVEPEVLLGHSIGGLTAATVAGVFSLRDAARLVSARARLMQAMPAGGAMVSLSASEVRVRDALRPFAATVSLAAINGPSSVVIAGSEADVAALTERFQSQGVQTKRLAVSHAFHSPLMDPMLAAFRKVAESIAYHTPRIPLVSDTIGTLAGPEITTADYWVRHVRDTVRFAPAVQAVARAGAETFLELGPRATLLGLVPACLPERELTLLSSIRSTRSEPEGALDALGGWVARGGNVDWAGVFPSGGRRVSLPNYPWQRERYWLDRRERATRAASVGAELAVLYGLEWQAVETPAAAPSLTGRWLVVTEPGEQQRDEALVVALQARGADAELVQLEELAKAVAADHVLCVWERALDSEAAMLDASRGLAVLQALGASSQPPHLWWVTREAVCVASNEDVAPAAATLWGLGRTLMQERPELRCRLLDIDSNLSVLDLILREAACDGVEDQIAWRSGQRRVARLVQVSARDSDVGEHRSKIRLDGTALVTGGLGALGLVIATSLAERGIKHLVLTGRRGMETPDAAAAIGKLEALGAQVTVASVDVADRELLARVFASIPEQYPLRVVVHAAGIIDDAMISEQTPERFAHALAPKVAGSWNLHQLTEHADLDAFVLFSSLAGTLGSAGQSNYAAANAYLDALAAHRRAHGLPALSLAWGPWGGSGMAAALDPKLQARFARQGIRLIPPSQGVSVFEATLGHPAAHLLAVPIDLQVFADTWGATVPALWRSLLPSASAAVRSPWLDELLELPASRRPEAVTQAVREEVARILSIPHADRVPRDKPLKDLGLDSLMAVELRSALSRRMGVSLPATLAFDHPTPEAIAKSVLARARLLEPAVTKPTVTTSPSDEPIAIVGIGCRFPGDVHDLDSFWQLLAEGRDAVSDVPRERWDVEALYDPDPDAAGKVTTRQGSFVSDIDRFDPSFFGISPREAKQLDPQQRLLLETSWEALEYSGIRPDTLEGSRTGVFVGLNYHEYGTLLGGLEDLDGYAGTGNAGSVASGRISYVLGLQGPSMTVDTACSSSLVTLHLASQALRNGECSLALAGGVTLMLTPATFVEFSRLRGLSPDGRCRTFSAEANGTGWSEGCGMLVLERLSDARKNGHPVLALIRGSAVNQDGRSNGLTAPNGPAQEAVILEALRRAGVASTDIGYVECHGTATTLGDPIEVQALGAVFSPGRSLARPVLIGSVKSNFGHTQAAAGAAGVIKTVLALQHGRIPQTLHFKHPNPHIAWSELTIKVASEPVDWPRTGVPRFAGVSSFGISGTNAHVVLEEAPLVEAEASAPARAAELVVLSGKTQEALSAVAGRLREHVETHPELALGDVAHSLVTTRSLVDHRLAVAVPSRTALLEALGVAASGQTPIGAQRGERALSSGKLAWLFTGQGAQRLGMGRELHTEWSAFREAFDAAVALLDPHLEVPLREVMWAEPGSAHAALLDQTGFTQPALFALEWALAALWRSWGVEPEVLLGHSIGGLTAATVAGVFSLEDAARLVSARARLMQALPAGGAMVSLAASETQVLEALRPFLATVSLAAINGPSSVVIAGREADVSALAERFQSQGVQTKRLVVSHAFHSPLMEPMLAAFREVAESVVYHTPRIPLVSDTTGTLAGVEITTAEHWVHHVRDTVRFAPAVQVVARAGASTFLELGPRATLLGLVPGCLPDSDPALLSSLRTGRSESEAVLDALGGWVVHGGGVDWKGVFPAGGRRVPLPNYPWQRERYWIDAQRPVESAGKLARWPLAGRYRELPSGAVHHVVAVGTAIQGYLQDHVVHGVVVVPGAFFVSVALACAAERWPEAQLDLEDVEFVTPLFLSLGERIELDVLLTPAEEDNSFVLDLATRTEGDGPWSSHARARARASASSESFSAPLQIQDLLEQTQPTSPEALIQRLSRIKIDWGPGWRWMSGARAGERAAISELTPPSLDAHDAAPLHPVLLDNGFGTFGLVQADAEAGDVPRLPFAMGRMRWMRPPVGAVRCGVQMHGSASATSEVVTLDMGFWDATGELVALVERFAIRIAPPEIFLRVRKVHRTKADNFFRVDWTPVNIGPVARTFSGKYLIIGEQGSSDIADLEVAVRQLGGVAICANAAEAVLLLSSNLSLDGVLCRWEASDGDSAAQAQQLAIDALKIVQALAAQSHPVRLWWVTRAAVALAPGEDVDAAVSTLWGLGRTVMQEHTALRCTLIDLERDASLSDILQKELSASDDENQVAWRSGKRHVARLVRAPVPPTRSEAVNCRLETPRKGTLDGLTLTPCERRSPAPGEVEIEVAASGLNFRDVLNALGMYPGDAGPLGGECSGVVTGVGAKVEKFAVGDLVMALAPAAFSRFVTVDSRLVAPVPSGLSMEQAATIPVAFLTAWHALHDLAKLQPGERIVIHAAAGGVGMAAIQLAHWIGAEVLATASPSKWAAVRALGVAHLASSRDLAFAQTFKATLGGADVVLNSLAGEFIDASLSLLSPGGRFVEMGKIDLRDAAQIASSHPGVRYRSFDLTVIAPDRIAEMLAAIGLGFESRRFVALPVRSFALTEAEAAFRFMAQARHTGKIVLLPPRNLRRTDGTVLVTGGLGALGLEIARDFARRGTQHLLLTGRRGLDTPGAEQAVAELRAMGVEVSVAAVDVADRPALARVLSSVPVQYPLRAVVHAAGVLDDGILIEQTPERFARVMAPKVLGAWNLHELTARADLDLFVLFSSMAGTFGSAGQGGYAAANAFLDGLAAHRRAQGLAGSSLAWGPWSEGGLAARLDARQQARFARQGIRMISPEQGRELLDQALTHTESQLVVAVLDLRVMSEALGAPAPPFWRSLVRSSSGRSVSASQGNWSRELAALPSNQRLDAVKEVVRVEIARVLSSSTPSAVPMDRPLKDLGLDSLMAVELRNALGRRSGVSLSATLAFDYPTPEAIAGYLLSHVLELADPSSKQTSVAAPPVAIAIDEPIAIIGMSCRFPGGANDPESLWQMLERGIDAVTEVPKDRWDIEDWYDPDPDAPGKMTTRWGGFLRDIERFDPVFFGLSPREAPSVDPQERLLLETTWEALEHAGLQPETLMGSDTGVYMGLCGTEYQTRVMSDAKTIDAYAMLGTAHSTIVGRISYWLGLKGPNMPVDTACSSSLVTVHLACQALRNRECGLALAGGANVMLSPEGTVYFSRLRAMSPTGRCHTFSADADGYVRAEGAGVVVLERLSDARRHGHRVLAIIRGSAVNQDGRSNGLTAPNGPSQQAVISEALRRGGVAPALVGYVECHGTGTPLGDPIEVQALAAVLSEGRSADKAVILGSLKSNVGHMEGAAGVGGLIKAVLTLQHGRIPKSLHFSRPNPHIAWGELAVKVASEQLDWPRNGVPRIAGVSSFGISGTNAHVVLEEAPSAEPHVSAPTRSAELVILSAKTSDALAAVAGRLRDHLEAHPELALADVARSLVTTRSLLDERLALAAPSRTVLLDFLAAAASGQIPVGAQRGRVPASSARLAWLFTGQGAQRLGMGRELYSEWSAFREAFDAASARFDPQLDVPLREVMWAEPGSAGAALLDETGFTQPAMFAFEWALAQLWLSWGVQPHVLLGHSIGGITAATVAGVFSLEDAARLVSARARLMQALPLGGAMVSVAAQEAQVREALRPFANVSLAAVNGPASVVIAGRETEVITLAEHFQGQGVPTKRLLVSHAFHSPLMDPMLAEFQAIAESITYHLPRIPLVSDTTGALAGAEIASPEYWVRHVRDTVRFAAGVKSLAQVGADTFLEFGPRPTLLALVPACLPDQDVSLLPSLRPTRPEAEGVLDALGGWVAQGGAVDWTDVFPWHGRAVSLPTYPWQRQRYWIDASAPVQGGGTPMDHPLLGVRIAAAGADAVYESVFSAKEPDWLKDYQIGGQIAVPRAALAELLRAAAEEHTRGASRELTSLVFRAPLLMPASDEQRVQVVLSERGTRASIYSQPARAQAGAEWTLHATAEIGIDVSLTPAPVDLVALRQRCSEPMDVAALYESFRAVGVDYGPAFQRLGRLWRTRGEALAEVVLDGAEPRAYGIQPALLEAALQLAGSLLEFPSEAPFLPSEIGRFAVHQLGSTAALVQARLLERTADVAIAQVTVADFSGAILAEIGPLISRRAELVVPISSPRSTDSGATDEVRRLPPEQRLEAVTNAIRSEVARVLSSSVAEVPLDRRLQDLGLDSLMAVEVRSSLSRRWGALPAALTFDKTLDEIAKTLLSQPSWALDPETYRESNGSSVDGSLSPGSVPGPVICERLHQPSRTTVRLFCFHDAGGSASMFLPFTRFVAPGIEVHTISCSRQVRNRETTAASQYLSGAVDYIRSLVDRPYAIFGHSLGSLFAWRVSQELARSGGRQPILLAPSAAPPGAHGEIAATFDVSSALSAILGEAASERALPSFREDFAADVEQWRAMTPPLQVPLDVPIAAFIGRNDPLVSPSAMEAWQHHTTRELSLSVLPGDHLYIYKPELCRLLASELSNAISRKLDTQTSFGVDRDPPRRSTTSFW